MRSLNKLGVSKSTLSISESLQSSSFIDIHNGHSTEHDLRTGLEVEDFLTKFHGFLRSKRLANELI